MALAESVMESISAAAIAATIPPKVCDWCLDATHDYNDCEKYKASVVKACLKCGEEDHPSRQCEVELWCFRCDVSGHADWLHGALGKDGRFGEEVGLGVVVDEGLVPPGHCFMRGSDGLSFTIAKK